MDANEAKVQPEFMTSGVLLTRDGDKVVGNFRMPKFVRLPEAVAWGSRMFILALSQSDSGPTHYHEIFCWPIVDSGRFGMLDPQLRTDT